VCGKGKSGTCYSGKTLQRVPLVFGKRGTKDRLSLNRVDDRRCCPMLSALLLLLHTLCFPLRLGSTGSFPRPLKAEEEREYLDRLAQGDLEARNKLVEHNLRLVSHIMKKYYVQASDQDDLISIGTIGLIKGITTFKPDKKVRLATYASRCIENAILT
jgi:RNA polymerase sporulation-specific sigma factor